MTVQVNATDCGQLRKTKPVRLRWKNLKQKATREHGQTPKTKPLKRGELSDVVLGIIGGERSQALHGSFSACVGEPIDEESLSSGSKCVFLWRWIPVKPSPSISTASGRATWGKRPCNGGGSRMPTVRTVMKTAENGH